MGTYTYFDVKNKEVIDKKILTCYNILTSNLNLMCGYIDWLVKI